MKHRLTILLPLLAVMLLAMHPASANTITYTATGCFLTTATGTCTGASSASFQDLRYAGASGTGVGFNPDPFVPGGLSASASFGTFWFASLPAAFTSESFSGFFQLTLTATHPLPGGTTTSDSATVVGVLCGPNTTSNGCPGVAGGSSNVSITFPPQYQHPTGTTGGVFFYNYNDPTDGSGRLGYHVQSITIPVTALSQATGVDLSGHFHEIPNAPSTVPEPTTYALFGSGFVALGLLRRRVAQK